MNWHFENDRPIYVQLVETLKLFIVTKKFKPGQRLLSVRDLAFEAKVNPNTMQRALAELESMGLIYTERTNGKFVTKDTKLLNHYKKEMALEKVNTYFTAMGKLGFTKTEALKYLKGDEK